MLRPSSRYNKLLVGNPVFTSGKSLMYGCSVDAVLRDWQDNVIDRAPLPLLFDISGRGKRSAQPKRAQKRARRGVTAGQYGNDCTLHLLISDIHTYLAAPCIIPAVPPSSDPSAQDPQHFDNGTAQELTAQVCIPSGDNLQTSNSFLCPLLLLSLRRP